MCLMRVVFFVLYFSKGKNHLITGKMKLEEQWLELGLGLGLRLGLFFVVYFSVLYFHVVFFRIVYIASTVR